MSARKWFAVGVSAALLLVPLVAIGQFRAIRHSGLNCYLSGGAQASVWVDLAIGGGPVHDWGLGSKSTLADNSIVYCPVTLDVPREEKNPIERVQILYSTRPAPLTGASPATVPEVKNCAAYLMDGTGPGTWVGQADPAAGDATAGPYTNGVITIENATATLGSVNLRRMVIVCNMSRGVLMGGSNTYTSLIKGYEVQYIQSP